MIEALRISAEVPPSLAETDRETAGKPDQNATAPQLIELLQVSPIKSYAAHFTIFGDYFLSVHIKRLFRRPLNYWIDLRYVEPMPARVFTLDRPALWTATTLGALSLLFFLTAWLSSQHLQWLTVAVSLLCAALLAALVLAQRSTYRIVFYSRYGHVPWFELLISNPKRRTVDAFIETLRTAISNGRQQHRDKRVDKLGAELREHRRLKEGKVLSEAAYAKVKARLLKQHGGTGLAAVSTDAAPEHTQPAPAAKADAANQRLHGN